MRQREFKFFFLCKSTEIIFLVIGVRPRGGGLTGIGFLTGPAVRPTVGRDCKAGGGLRHRNDELDHHRLKKNREIVNSRFSEKREFTIFRR